MNEYLVSLNKSLKELIHLSHQDFENIDDCLLAYIQFGIAQTGFSTGVVSYIEGGDYTVLQAVSPKKDFNKGLVVALCDTLCNKAYQTGKTLFNTKLKDTDLYDLPARSFLNIEAILCTPLFIHNEIYGTLTFCSETELESDDKWTFLTSLVELLGQSLSNNIKEHMLLEKLEEDKKLLDMGSELLKMGAYKRNIETGEVICTDGVYQLFEVEKEETRPLLIEELLCKVAEVDKAKAMEILHKSNRTDIAPFDYRIVTKNGSFKWLRQETKCESDKGYVLGIIQDITASQNNLKHLEAKNKELKELTYAAAHDLQEPLRAINGFSDLLSLRYKSKIDEKGQEFLSYLMDASNRMKAQIDGLLAHSIIGRTGIVQIVDLEFVMNDLVLGLKTEIKQSNALLKREVLPKVKGYPVELRMLFQNLLSNAIKFRREGIPPQITINCTSDSDFWYFSITDNGIGIEEAYIDKVFELFVRLNSRSAFKGTGIGLTHCKKIVQLHGGDIYINSEIGVGTMVKFSLKK